MSKQAIEGARRGNIFFLDPDRLTLIEDPNHILYDPRVKLPPDPGMMASIAAEGLRQPVGVRKDGNKFEVVWGRRRVKAIAELNKNLKKTEKRFEVSVVIFKGTDQEAYQALITENLQRQDDPPSMVAQKLAHGIKFGCTEKDLAIAAGCTPETIRNRLKLLDAAPQVLKAVDEGLIGEVQARKLTDLPREEQKKTLDEMIQTGALRGAKSRKIIADKTDGKNGHKETGGRMMNRAEANKWLDELSKNSSEFSGAVVGTVRMMLRDMEALGGKYQNLRPKFLFEQNGEMGGGGSKRADKSQRLRQIAERAETISFDAK